MKSMFTTIGVLTTIVVLFFVFWVIFYGIKELLIALRRWYIIKHRFDKPPTAKCHCKDCKRWRSEDGKCFKFDGWLTADSWFCWDAEPRTDIKN